MSAPTGRDNSALPLHRVSNVCVHALSRRRRTVVVVVVVVVVVTAVNGTSKVTLETAASSTWKWGQEQQHPSAHFQYHHQQHRRTVRLLPMYL